MHRSALCSISSNAAALRHACRSREEPVSDAAAKRVAPNWVWGRCTDRGLGGQGGGGGSETLPSSCYMGAGSVTVSGSFVWVFVREGVRIF